MTSRCHDCDKPLARDGDREHPTNCAHCYEVCWRAVHGDICQWPPVDWEARALAAEALIDVDPADVIALASENERLLAGFNEALARLRAGQPVRSCVCCWCGQHWPQLEGDSFETLRKYTNEHAQVCPANELRIERDKLRARCLELESALTSVCDPSGSDAEHWRRVGDARGVLGKECK
jgi:hypothetical protein